MKIQNLILILPLFLFLNNINAQEVIIGKDSVVVWGLPFVDGDYYSYSQTIYNQKYIHAIGNISKISYYYNGGDTYSDSVNIYMGHTMKSAFSGDDYVPVDSLILVYDGLFSATTEGWAEIELDLSFSYNNIDNLVIAFDDNTRNYHNGDFYCTTLDDENYKSIFYYSYDDLNPADMSFGYETKYIPNIKIEGSLTITDHFYVLGDTNRQISTDYNSTVIYNIETNASDFTVTCSATWLDLNYDTGAKTVTLTSNSPVNTISESRTANIVISSDGFDDINANVTQSLFEETQIDLPEVLAGSIEFGDYDRDGDMDFLYTQSYGGYSEIYENSLNIFNTINAGLIEASYGDATWGDYDNDGDLDFAIAGKDGSGNLNTKIYQNKGNSVFDTIQGNLMGLYNGSLDWGDYDNDGDLDLLVTGTDASNTAYSILYRNDGGNIFVDAEINIPACKSGSVEWGDYNNDNILDILMSGIDINGNRYTTILKNNGPGSSEFIDIQAGLKGLSNSSVSSGDYDLDGDLDILISGCYYEYSSPKYFSAVYRNDGNDIFTNINAGLIDVSGKGVAWGDYDNDGDLDIFLTGYYRTSDYSIIYIFKIYQNQGNDLFIETDALSTEFSINKITLGDYDGDSDLDILCTGSTTENSFIKIYRNNINIVNTEPEMPDGLSATVQDDNVILSWNPSTDAETHSKGLTYNIGFGTENDSFNIVSPMVDTLTGYRKSIPTMGNAMLDTNYLLTELDTGMYYWTVQAVDNGFLSSDFHEIDSFIVVPTFTDSEISLQKGYGSSVAWGDYNNDGYLDVAIMVIDDTSIEYSKIYRNDGNNNFVDIVANIIDIYCGAVNWGDYDNDGDLDLAITGRQISINDTIISTIYRNDGNDVFEDIGAQLTAMYDGFVEWGDLDNDGDLDLLLGGFPQLRSDSGSVTIVYRNDGNDIFTEIETEIPGVGRSFADISDYDNDGDMDIIISGKTGTFPLFTFITKIYRNDDNFSFTDINAGLTGVNDGSVEWGDYDNDGHLDILITGYDDASNKILKIYHNDGSDSFTEIYINTRGVATGNATWGDYDNDGFLDILVAGYSGNAITKIYRNNRNGDFNEIITSIPGVANSSVAWGNYDNDSDLDIIISGGLQSSLTKIFNNNTNYPNDCPSFPTNLQTENWGYGIKLMWDKASDNQGEENGLSYNVRIGATSNGIEIMSPASRIDSTYNLIPKMGNVQTNTSWRIDSLAEGTYYWNVQAVDQSFTAGEWAIENSFTVTRLRPNYVSDTVCFGDSTSFIDMSLSTGTLIEQYNWNFGDGNFSNIQNPKHLFESSGKHYITLEVTDTAGITQSKTDSIFVLPKPIANFSVNNVCIGSMASMVNISDTDTLNITNWLWDYGDGSTSTLQHPGPYGYLNTGIYEITLSVLAQNGCVDSIKNPISVAEYPVSNIAAGGNPEFCEGDNVKLSVPENSFYIYQWKIGGVPVSGADSSVYLAYSSGNYTVSVTNQVAGCNSESLTPVTVLVSATPSPPLIQTNGTITFCEGDSVVLSVTNNTSLDYQWKLNGGAIGVDTNLYIAKSSGNYILEVSNSTGCVALSSNSVDVTVNEVPDKPVVSLSGLTGFCEGDSLILSVDNESGIIYQWCNENGEILNANSNQYVTYNSGDFYLDITNSSNCINTSNTTNVTVSEMPLKPVINTTGYDINDCPQEKIILLSVDQPTVQYDYQWQRNGVPIDGETESSIENYLNEGDYSVIANNNGCANESDITGIYYDPELPEKPGIIATGPNVWYLACTNDKAQQYEWYYNNEIITGANAYLYVANQNLGTYFVKIAEENGCFVSSDAVTIPLTATGIDDVNPFANLKIYPNPTPGMFTIEMDNNLFGELITRIFARNAVEILNIKFHKTTQHFIAHVDLSGQGKGVYLISFTLDKYKAERKIVVE